MSEQRVVVDVILVGILVLRVPAVQQLGHGVERCHLHAVERVGGNVLADQREQLRVATVIVPVDAGFHIILGQFL